MATDILKRRMVLVLFWPGGDAMSMTYRVASFGLDNVHLKAFIRLHYSESERCAIR